MPNGGVFDTCAQCPFYTAAVIGEFIKPFNENSHPEKFCTIREIEINDDIPTIDKILKKIFI